MTTEQLTLPLEPISIKKEVKRQGSFEINAQAIQAELKELAGSLSLKVKLDKNMRAACWIYETDSGFLILFNPKKIKNPEKLEEHLNHCRNSLTL